MEWGLHQGKKLDTDLTDEAAWQARPEFAARSKARMAKDAKALKSANKSVQQSLSAASHTVLDTDHTDETAWKARRDLKARSKMRRAKEAKALKEKNRQIFSKIRKTQSSDEIDDDLRDEEEWQIRPDLQKLSLQQRDKEADDLQIKNADMRARLRRIQPKIVLTSEKGLTTYREGNGWLEACTFRALTVRSRDKYSPMDEDRSRWIRTDGEAISPSWLKRTDKYEYALTDR